MHQDGSEYTRYKSGERVIFRENDSTHKYWSSDFDRLVGKPVTIVDEFSDSDGYYYSIKESPYSVDVSFLMPINAFGINDDDDIVDVEASIFAEGFAVEA